MKKGQEPGQLDKEAVGRITCRILQEEEPGGMLVKKLWRLAGMLICLLCLTGGLCSAFLSGFGIRYLVPVFWMLLIVSVLFWIGFSRLPLEGVYRLLAILGTLIGVSLFLLLLQKDVIAGYMSAVNGVQMCIRDSLETGCGCGNRERKIWDFLFRVVFSRSLPEKDIRALSRALGCPRKNGAEKMQKRRLPQAFDLCLSL